MPKLGVLPLCCADREEELFKLGRCCAAGRASLLGRRSVSDIFQPWR